MDVAETIKRQTRDKARLASIVRRLVVTRAPAKRVTEADIKKAVATALDEVSRHLHLEAKAGNHAWQIAMHKAIAVVAQIKEAHQRSTSNNTTEI